MRRRIEIAKVRSVEGRALRSAYRKSPKTPTLVAGSVLLALMVLTATVAIALAAARVPVRSIAVDADGVLVPPGAVRESRRSSGDLVYVTYSVRGSRSEIRGSFKNVYLSEGWRLLAETLDSLLFEKDPEGAGIFPSDNAVVVA